MRKLIACLSTAAFLLAGCWSRIEINDLGAVISLAVDRTDGGLLDVTMSVAQPGAASGGKAQPGGGGVRRTRITIRRRGRTIAEAVNLAEQASPRRVALDHIEVILLGERLVYDDVDALLDYLLRSAEVRLSSHVVLSQGSPPHEILEATPTMRSTQSEALRELESKRASLMITLKDFFIARSSPHISPILSALTLVPHLGKEQGAPDMEVVISGAVVLKEGTGVLTMDRDQLQATEMLLTDARDAVFTIPCPGGNGGNMSIRITGSRRKIEPVWDGKRLSFGISITGDSSIADLQCHLDVSDPQRLLQIGTELNKVLAQRLSNVISETQKHEVDPMRYGESVRVKYPALWREIGGKRWLSYWRNVPVQVRPNIEVTHVNLTVEPPNTEKGSTKD